MGARLFTLRSRTPTGNLEVWHPRQQMCDAIPRGPLSAVRPERGAASSHHNKFNYHHEYGTHAMSPPKCPTTIENYRWVCHQRIGAGDRYIPYDCSHQIIWSTWFRGGRKLYVEVTSTLMSAISISAIFTYDRYRPPVRALNLYRLLVRRLPQPDSTQPSDTDLSYHGALRRR